MLILLHGWTSGTTGASGICLASNYAYILYIWADGLHFGCRLTDDRPCVLVIMGATEDGTKELIAPTGRGRASRAG